MIDRKPDNLKARTIVEISGECIETIPVGTKFVVTYLNYFFSSCSGLGITSIYNCEFEIIVE